MCFGERYLAPWWRQHARVSSQNMANTAAVRFVGGRRPQKDDDFVGSDSTGGCLGQVREEGAA
jgi:hypothetical protein